MPKIGTITFVALATAGSALFADDISRTGDRVTPYHISNDAEYRRAERFDSVAPADGTTRLSTAESRQAEPRHISDDAAARRAQRFDDTSSVAEVSRLSSAPAPQAAARDLSDDAEYRRAQRFSSDS